MPEGLFVVQLSAATDASGRPRLQPPPALADVDFRYLSVKQGGTEAIVRVTAAADGLKTLERSEGCKKLTARQAEQLRGSYATPSLKRQCRPRQLDVTDAMNVPGGQQGGGYALDTQGQAIVDVFQTVRLGFNLIDVPIETPA